MMNAGTLPKTPENGSGASARCRKGSPDGKGVLAMSERVWGQIRGLPQIVEDNVQSRPYAVLAVAGGVGFLLGAFAGSRLLRTLLVTVGASVVTEALRAYASGALRDFTEKATDGVDSKA